MSGINLVNLDLDPLFRGFNFFREKNKRILKKSLRTLFSQKKEKKIEIKNNNKENINKNIFRLGIKVNDRIFLFNDANFDSML